MLPAGGQRPGAAYKPVAIFPSLQHVLFVATTPWICAVSDQESSAQALDLGRGTPGTLMGLSRQEGQGPIPLSSYQLQGQPTKKCLTQIAPTDLYLSAQRFQRQMDRQTQACTHNSYAANIRPRQEVLFIPILQMRQVGAQGVG